MKHVLHLFAIYLGTGILGLTPLLDHRRIQDSFFRLISAIALPALLIAWLTRPTGAPPPGFASPALLEPAMLFLIAGALAYVTLIWSGKPVWAGRLSWLLVVASVVVLVLQAEAHTLVSGGELRRAMLPLAIGSSAGMLGSVLVAMSLGHWYLVSPGLPVSHLHKVTIAMAAFVALSLVVFLASAAGIMGSSAAALGADPQLWLLSNVPFLAMRFLLGIVAPAILAWRIDQFVRVRSTQKATGLLYVALIFVLFGELLSAYLLVLTAMPT